MKVITTILTLTILILTNFSVFGQVDCDTTQYPKLINNSFQCKWTFFQLKDTTNGIIIKHEKQTIGCGSYATASLTIIFADSDTIRVLDMCNQLDYHAGQTVKIIPSTTPPFQVHIPWFVYVSDQSSKKLTPKEKEEQKKKTSEELSISRSNEFDEKIKKTTWGQIIVR
ncbi:MAG: hypothetical protein V4511_07785 [Bacteroidota bacterium]